MSLDRDSITIRDIVSENQHAVWDSQIETLDVLIDKAFLKLKSRETISAEEILEPLGECGRQLEMELCGQASGYSQLEWLWFLRRFPADAFAYQHPEQGLHLCRLAETATGVWGNSSRTHARGHQIQYQINAGKLRRMLKLCVTCQYYSDVQTCLRYSGLGIAFRPERRGLPRPMPSGDEAAAISIYRKRRMGWSSIFQSLGTSGSVQKANYDHERGLIVVERKSGEVFNWRPLAMGDFIRLTNATKDSTARWWPENLQWILWFSKLQSEMLCGLGDLLLPDVERFGYFFMNRSAFTSVFEARRESVSEVIAEWLPGALLPSEADELLNRLEGITGSLSPGRSGPAVRVGADFCCFDCWTLRWMLEEMMVYPKSDGAIANVRAEHFEDSVQALIDFSVWRPGDGLLRIRRRTLKMAGRPLTDIDAIGRKGKTLLLVSCKSRIFDDGEKDGEGRSIANTSTIVTEAVKRWDTVIELLTRQRKGDNFDFSEYSQIVGIVITPFVPHVPFGPAVVEGLPGLYACSSSAEFSTWLCEQKSVPE